MQRWHLAISILVLEITLIHLMHQKANKFPQMQKKPSQKLTRPSLKNVGFGLDQSMRSHPVCECSIYNMGWVVIHFSLTIIHTTDFFTSLVSAAEARLRIHNVRSRGCADGDLPLGQYTSLRNEAYVKRRLRKLVHQNGAVTYGDEQSWLLSETAAAEWQMLDEWIYPRNNDGWNAAHHSCPVSIFDCRCAAASVPVQARRYFHWQELEKETTPYTKRDKQSPMNRWLE